jgi:two-component system LytT family response regulator
MTRLRALIVDDEPLARERVRTLLAAEPDVETVGECSDGAEAVAAIERLAPDLVLLDVQMPEVDGFEVLQAIPAGRLPAVIFITAYDRYALKAFEVHALDYLLKPFDRERFGLALDRARAQFARGGTSEPVAQRLLELLEHLRAERQHARRLVVRESGRVFFLDVAEIDWVEAVGNYARLHVGKRSHLLRETMKVLEGRLDPERFVRVHRSSIVNVERIRLVETTRRGDHGVVLVDGTHLAASRGYAERLRVLMAGGKGRQ